MCLASGVYAVSLPAKTVDAIWDSVVDNARTAVLVHHQKNEFGFAIRQHGERSRQVIDHFGIPLMMSKK